MNYYEEFAAEHAGDSALQSEVADAWFRLGEIEVLLGDQASAKNAHDKALELRKALARDDPRDVDKQPALARSHVTIAAYLGPRAAIAELEKAIAITRNKSLRRYRGTLGEAYLALGVYKA